MEKCGSCGRVSHNIHNFTLVMLVTPNVYSSQWFKHYNSVILSSFRKRLRRWLKIKLKLRFFINNKKWNKVTVNVQVLVNKTGKYKSRTESLKAHLCWFNLMDLVSEGIVFVTLGYSKSWITIFVLYWAILINCQTKGSPFTTKKRSKCPNSLTPPLFQAIAEDIFQNAIKQGKIKFFGPLKMYKLLKTVLSSSI